jgi:HEAT repeat protein
MASYPTPATRDRLISVLTGRSRDGGDDNRNRERRAGDVPKDSPLRGFAALALGLYARPYKTDQGAADRPGFDTAAMTLVERLEDDREEEEVRTACAVALGLTQRSAVLPVFHRATARLQQRNRRVDFPMVGFLLLGRALAGDKSLIEPASQFLLNRDDDPSPGGILSRRAAVLALGLTRSGNAIPVLTKAWHLNHYVNREVILALRLVGGTNAAEPVMQRLRESKDDEERAYMAQALGELLAAERPTTLDRLTAGCNFTVRNDEMRPLQALANGFLYDYLIASFGENW